MTTTKETNPKDAFGSQKVGLSCVPMTVVLELATAMREGVQKYGRYNWRESGVRSSVYFDAAIRHLFAWWEGEEIDPDSGISHLTKAIASLAVLRDGQMQSETQPELFNDDRPVSNVEHLVTKMNTKIANPKASFRTFIMDLSPEGKTPVEDGCGNAVVPFPGMEELEPESETGETIKFGPSTTNRRVLSFKEIVDRYVEETKKEVLEQFRKDRDKSILTPGWSGTAPTIDPTVTATNNSIASLNDAQLEEKIGPQDHLYNTHEYALLRNRLIAIPTRYALNLVDGLESELTTGVQFIPSKIDEKDLYQRLLALLRRFNKESQVAHLADLRKVAIRLDNSPT